MTVVRDSFSKPVMETHYPSFCPALGGRARLGVVRMGPIMRNLYAANKLTITLYLSALCNMLVLLKVYIMATFVPHVLSPNSLPF